MKGRRGSCLSNVSFFVASLKVGVVTGEFKKWIEQCRGCIRERGKGE